VPATAAERAPRIDVAGTVLEFHGLRGAALRWARTRYGGFLTTRRARFTVDVRRGRTVAQPAAISSSGGRLQATLNGYRWRGDVASGRFELVAPEVPSALSPAALRLLCAALLLDAGGVMLHAASVVDRGRAWVFCGVSGSGKTTIARLAGRRRVLSDETTALRPGPAGWRACATPFFGEGGPVMGQRNGAVPVRALFFLEKADAFAHRALSRREAVERGLAQVFVPKNEPAVVASMLAALDRLTAAVPSYVLRFAATDAIWSYVDGI
jgi:hypothetical protein